MDANQGMRPATKADIEEVAAGLNKEFVRLEKNLMSLRARLMRLKIK
jgi:hypothetical protein